MTTSQPMAFDAEKESLVLDAVARFVEREIKPVAQRLEHADEWPVGIVAGMREMGLFGCIIREEYGGLGLSASTYAKVVERIARVWMSVSGIINSHLIMAACVQRHRGAAPAFSAALCQRRTARRAGTDRARLRHRSAGGAHGGAPRR